MTFFDFVILLRLSKIKMTFKLNNRLDATIVDSIIKVNQSLA